MKSLQITKSSVKGDLLTLAEGKYNEPKTKVNHSKSLWVIDTILVMNYARIEEKYYRIKLVKSWWIFPLITTYRPNLRFQNGRLIKNGCDSPINLFN